MPALQPGSQKLLDRSNGQSAAFSTSTPLYSPSPAPMKSTREGFVQQEALQSDGQDTFACFRNFVESSVFADNNADECREYDDGYTNSVGNGSAEHVGGRFLDRPGSFPCNLSARLANRSNGAPLATIIEQCSRSTLNSRVSLLSVGRAASLTASESVSPYRGSQRKLNTSDDIELSEIPEHVPPVDYPSTLTEIKPANERRNVPPTTKNASHIQSTAVSPVDTTDFQIGTARHTTSSQRLSSFFRDVLHTVQTTSRTRPWSSLLIQTTNIEAKDTRAEPKQNIPRSHQRQSDVPQPIRDKSGTPHAKNGSIPGSTPTPLGDSQTRSRKTSLSEGFETSARAVAPLLKALPHEFDIATVTSSVPHLLPPSVATRSRERSASVHPVQPKPRDVAHYGGTAEVPSLQGQRRSDTPVHYAFESVPICPGDASSLPRCDRAFESSRNASFCSTMSTSYSGTVLGVDLDLGAETFGPQSRRCSRSSTPVAHPVWFTPQMGELERQASVSESPEQIPHDRPTTVAHSIKSFALTSLLPIAAASGIVTPNYTTPKISFYSPSGNLIQPDSGSSPGTNSSDSNGSPTLNNTYHQAIRSTPLRKASAHATISSSTTRPPLVPMTTPPIFSTPLPAHLRHHHNYCHPEMSQIESTESFVIHAPAVIGCGGMVRSPSFTPRSGIHQHKKSKSGSYHNHHRSVKSVVNDLRFEANFYKAGLITKASTFCGPKSKGKTLRKRPAANTRTHEGSSSNTRNNSSSAASTVVVEEKARIPSTSPEHDHSTLGPLAGHALRVCFCQPYDGAGRSIHVATADAPCISKSKSASDSAAALQAERMRARESDKEQDGELPNFRIVGRTAGSADQGEKKAAIGKPGIRARGRSDSVVSVGVGLRVAAVGA